MLENDQRIGYFIKWSGILFMRYFSGKLSKWNFSEQNEWNNSEKKCENIYIMV